MSRVHIVGVLDSGPESLNPAALRLVEEAELLYGGKRLLDWFAGVMAEKVALGADLAEAVARIKESPGRRIVVLASGDPNFYGIAKYLLGHLPKEQVEIVPNVSSVQLAFARIKESWEDAALVSFHARPITSDALAAIEGARKVAILTDNTCTPAAIAKELLDRGMANCRAYVCEDLGGEKEAVTETDLVGLIRRKREFSPLNVLILLREAPSPFIWRLGIPEDKFQQRRYGLITKAEVRVISLSKLRLRDNSIVWDIGSGSGSVAIEAALLVRRGFVYAIEKNPADVRNIQANIRTFGTDNVAPVLGGAPEALEGLAAPDAVFVGGSGGRMKGILREVSSRLAPGGRVVINLATLENLQVAMDSLRQQGLRPEVTQVAVSRGHDVAGLTHLVAFDPVFIVSAEKRG